MTQVKNKVVLITGGTSGIGRATANKFIEDGAKVIITGRYEKHLTETVRTLGKNCKGLVSDAGKMEDIYKLRNQVEALTPHIDTLFVNAGYGKFASIESTEEPHYDELFQLLAKAPFFTIQQLLPLLKPKSSVVVTTSAVTEVGIPNFSVYSAAKSTVQSFVKTFAMEFLEKKIRINAVSPGYISTKGFEKTGMNEEQIKHTIAQITPTLPFKRFGKPEEVAHAVCFLASEEASYITGTELLVDGGWLISKN